MSEHQMATIFHMGKKSPSVFPAGARSLKALGERLRAARLRRRLTQAVVATRIGVSTPTLAQLEAGNPRTSLATLLRLLEVLGLGTDIDRIAVDDELGRRLQDMELKDAPRGRGSR
jgi:transcriptional regulator with XRE-family HTH domain